MADTRIINLQANPEWKNLQTQNQYLEYDTTEESITLVLPNIADLQKFWGVKLNITVLGDGSSELFIKGFTQDDPPVENTINGSIDQIELVITQSCIITVGNDNNWNCIVFG